nr:2A [mischivirus C1]
NPNGHKLDLADTLSLLRPHDVTQDGDVESNPG